MEYNSFKYLFPPRAETKIKPINLEEFDDSEDYLAQPKFNGSCAVLFLPGNDTFQLFNRHKEEFSSSKFKANEMNLAGIHRGDGWMVVAGELMNKAAKGEDGELFNNKFIIWDILVYENNYLVGNTNEERQILLDSLYPTSNMEVAKYGFKQYGHIHCIGLDGVYKSRVYTKYFSGLYDSIIKTDAYEGLILKKRLAKLEFGFTPVNNHRWQVKCRKPTKNYSY